MTNDKMIEAIGNNVLDDLTDRRGFRQTWDDCDDVIRQEIRTAIGEAALRAVRENQSAYEKFFRDLWSKYCAMEIADTEDAALILEIALRHGLVREEKYNSDIHGEKVGDALKTYCGAHDFESGDPIYFANTLPTPPAEKEK